MRFLKRIKHLIYGFFSKAYREKRATFNELLRLKNIPRYTTTETDLLDNRLVVTDAASFLFMYHEIFKIGIYKFNSSQNSPYIIDCGANIGLSIIYFKQLYPNAEIVAFEPDEKVFNVLSQNLESFKLTGVELVQKACWNKETVLKFYSEGADGGRVASNTDQDKIIEVETIRLRDYLNRKVDFLKIDIEGAENEVIADIEDMLYNVERIFVEFHSFNHKEQMLPELLATLKKAGFRLHISSPGLVSKNPFIELNNYAGMDNQLNIYGFRG